MPRYLIAYAASDYDMAHSNIQLFCDIHGYRQYPSAPHNDTLRYIRSEYNLANDTYRGFTHVLYFACILKVTQ